MLQTENLRKVYGAFVAVDRLDLNVRAGEIYGFLGPNGAGKTTSILMMLGIHPPSAGQVKLFGQPINGNRFEITRRIGVMSERQFLYDDLSAAEYLAFFGQMYRVPKLAQRISELLEVLNLARFRNVLAKDYSQGMKQKLGLARALLHDPDLLILDEPVSGLDPHGILQVRNILLEQKKRGKAIFISSHVLSEIEKTADRVGIINKGRLLAEDQMENIRRKLRPHDRLEIEVQGALNGVVPALRALSAVRHVEQRDAMLHVQTDAERDYRAAVSQCITQHGGIIVGMRKIEMSLEEAFMTITEQNLSLLTDS